MRSIFFIGVSFFLSVLLHAQSPDDFEYRREFDRVRNYLLDGQTHQALPMLQSMVEKYPNNSNLNYLLGVCYTESPEVTDMSIYHLEKARKDVSPDYSANSYLEQKAPVFLYYFLVVAYAQNKLCRKAEDAFFQFHSLYGSYKEDFYVSDARLWVKKCEIPEELQLAETKTQTAFEKQSTERNTPQPQEVESGKRSYVTKPVEYSTNRPLYGVQVGAFSRVVPVYKFEGLKNVEAFLDHEGFIRYVVGHFSSRSQAESLLKIIRSAGYKDAFIVDVNKEKVFSEELVIYNEKSIHKKEDKVENIDFSVQIGAFRDSIPGELAQKYLLIDDIREMPQDNLTILLTGSFKSYADAQSQKDQLIQMGIPGAFVVAFKNGQKIPLKKSMITGKEED